MLELIATFNKIKGQKEELDKTIKGYEDSRECLQISLDNYEKADVIIKTCSLKTQEKLQVHIADIVSLALAAVFQHPYVVEVDFVERRGKTECDVWFVKEGNSIKPIDGAGGGALDVASIAFRLAMWSLQPNKSNNVMVLDEPFKHLSTGLQPKANTILNEIALKLGLQLIMVTHTSSEELDDEVTTKFTVKLNNGISEVSSE